MTVLGKKEIQMVSRAEQEKTIFQFLSAYADMTWKKHADWDDKRIASAKSTHTSNSMVPERVFCIRFTRIES
jgi:hypothetical protein